MTAATYAYAAAHRAAAGLGAEAITAFVRVERAVGEPARRLSRIAISAGIGALHRLAVAIAAVGVPVLGLGVIRRECRGGAHHDESDHQQHS